MSKKNLNWFLLNDASVAVDSNQVKILRIYESHHIQISKSSVENRFHQFDYGSHECGFHINEVKKTKNLMNYILYDLLPNGNNFWKMVTCKIFGQTELIIINQRCAYIVGL